MTVSEEEIGRYKIVKPEDIINAAKIVKEGKIYDLSVEVNRKSSNAHGSDKDIFPEYNLVTYLAPEKNKEYTSTRGITWGTELITGGVHNFTHLDALSHIQYNGKVYKKFDVEKIFSNFGTQKCGVETVPPIISRGILIDVAGLLNVDKLEDNHEITKNEILKIIEVEGIEVKLGDTVLFRTGKIKDFGKESYMEHGPGIGIEAAMWLYNKGMCVLGTDWTCIEVKPINEKNCVHKEMIYERGIYLIENLFLDELAKNKVYEFFFICLPIKFTGSTGSWVRPVAII